MQFIQGRALNQLVVEAVAFFKLSAIHYLAHCNLNVASGLHRLRGDISPSGTITWITREGYESDWKMVVSRIQDLDPKLGDSRFLFMYCFEAEAVFM